MTNPGTGALLRIILTIVLLGGCLPVARSTAAAQQVVDSTFRPRPEAPAFPAGAGPVVLIDAAHGNSHTLDGTFAPFAALAASDGFIVWGNHERLTAGSLTSARILVIANATTGDNRQEWSLESAFDDEEIDAVKNWVRGGGSLLLIADHMPFPGAAYALAAEFGALFGNGFALDSILATGEMRFRRSDESLADHPIVRGRSPSESVDSVVAFTGQAFRLVAGGEPIMRLGRGTFLVLPQIVWGYTDRTPRIPAEGMLQGAVLRFGQGRVALFGEAGMFTAQLAGPQARPMGMNAPHARHNAQFVLNVLRWLSGLLDGPESPIR
jgi:hypothetical protein